MDNIRETLDQGILMCNLTSCIDVCLLGFGEFFGRRIFFEGHLEENVSVAFIMNRRRVMLRFKNRVGCVGFSKTTSRFGEGLNGTGTQTFKRGMVAEVACEEDG